MKNLPPSPDLIAAGPYIGVLADHGLVSTSEGTACECGQWASLASVDAARMEAGYRQHIGTQVIARSQNSVSKARRLLSGEV